MKSIFFSFISKYVHTHSDCVHSKNRQIRKPQQKCGRKKSSIKNMFIIDAHFALISEPPIRTKMNVLSASDNLVSFGN